MLARPLPRAVEIGGELVPIRVDFRVGVRLAELMEDPEAGPAEKLSLAVEMYFPRPPAAPIQETLEALGWFYRCGRPPRPREKGGDSPRLFDYRQDGGLIYSAFLGQYGLDLTQCGELHWWKFRALMEGLGPDCLFRQVMAWRAAPFTEDMSPHQRRLLAARKAFYRLDPPPGSPADLSPQGFEEMFI